MRMVIIYLMAILYPCLGGIGFCQVPPESPAFEPFSYVCATDPHLTTSPPSWDNLRLAAQQAQQNGCETLLVTGDLFNVVDYSAPYLWGVLRDTLSVYKGRLALMPGNHDIASLDQLALYRQLSGSNDDYYAFRIQDCEFVCMDTETLLHEGTYYQEYHRQWDWLTNELQTASQAGSRRIFLFGHHPPYIYFEDETSNFWDMPRKERKWLLDMSRQYGVYSITAGHWHTTAAFAADNPQIYITGGSGYSVDGSGCGYRYFIVGRRDVRQFYVRTDGPKDKTAPTSPTLLVVAGRTANSLTLEWTRPVDNVGVSRYEIWRDGAPLPKAFYDESYTDDHLKPGESHTYAVAAFDPVGNRSGFSPLLTASASWEASNLITTQSLWRWSPTPAADDRWKTAAADFADGTWMMRVAEDATVTSTGLPIGDGRTTTSYFRRVFTANPLSNPAKFTLRFLPRHGNITAYLNGNEIVQYDDLAVPDGQWAEIEVDRLLLRPGDNILAVELTSQTPVLDMELIAEPIQAAADSWKGYE